MLPSFEGSGAEEGAMSCPKLNSTKANNKNPIIDERLINLTEFIFKFKKKQIRKF